jgi:hypothetical protein
LQIHEPVLTLSGSEELTAGAAACYAALAAEGVPINIVVPYDDVPGALPMCSCFKIALLVLSAFTTCILPCRQSWLWARWWLRG